MVSSKWKTDLLQLEEYCGIGVKGGSLGIKDGLELLPERNYDSVLIQTDSIEAINAIQG
ncbi:hypothetical protein Golob_008455 [Gossypium lobatum]|uniref:RNase H type-1 domain-containing protein n=1 Tax=Gossypium lobatum TaxID=34289 RepID=A0A7J8MFH7_9ROSI|nr:hypothetical protein [Gossypium lobatum]